MYFHSFTLPWRYWTKLRSKETLKISLSVCQWNLIVYLLTTSQKLHRWKHIFQCINTISYAYQKYTWDSSTPDSLLKIDGYILVCADHPNNIKRGGVCIYFKKSLPVRVVSLRYLKEALLLEMTYNNNKVIVSVIPLP